LVSYVSEFTFERTVEDRRKQRFEFDGGFALLGTSHHEFRRQLAELGDDYPLLFDRVRWYPK